MLDADFAPDSLLVNFRRSSAYGPGSVRANTSYASYFADASTINTGLLGNHFLQVRDTVILGGAFTSAAGAYTPVTGQSGGRRGLLVLPPGATSFGHFYLDGFGSDATVTTAGGPFLLGPSDSLEARYANGSNILSQLTNQGYMLVVSGSALLVEKGSTTHTSSGEIDVAGTLNIANFVSPPAGRDFVNSGLIKVLGGTVNLNNAGTFTNGPTGYILGTGTLNIRPGTTFLNLGTISPGFSPGGLTINGPVTQGASAKLKVEISGKTPVTQFDQVNVSGAMALNGSLDLSIYGCAFFPVAGDTFRILNAASVTGTFSSVAGQNMGSGLSFQVLYRSNGVTLLAVGTYTNARPLAVDDHPSVAANLASFLNPLANDSDPDGSLLSIVALLTPGTHGSVAINSGGGSVTYAPPNAFSGPDSFYYVVSDCHGGLDTALVAVNVGGITGAGAPPVRGMLSLSKGMPNPFTHSTSLRFELPGQGKVTLAVYDVTGRQVCTLVDEVRGEGVSTPCGTAAPLLDSALQRGCILRG